MAVLNQPRQLLFGVCLVLTLALFVSCKQDDTPATTHTVTDIVLVNPNFTLLRAAIQRAGLADQLRGGTLTVFAPTDEAFRAAGYADVTAINAVPAASLTALLQYHVIGNRIPVADVPTARNTPVQSLLTTNGILYITKINNNLSVNGRTVTTADVTADNGVVHVIDGLLIPPTGDVVSAVLGNPQSFSLLAAAVQRAGTGLITALQSTTAATIFAPTNEAFIAAGYSAAAIAGASPAALQQLLSYHVVPGRLFSTQLTDGLTPTTLLGSTIRINLVGISATVTGQGNGAAGATIVSPNNLSTNAVVHAIDRVLLPPP